MKIKTSANPPAGQPHDSLFRAAFSSRRRAVNFLRKFLPKEIVSKVNWSSLKVENIPGVAASLRQNRNDLIYRLNWKEGTTQREARIFVLLEHQSQPEHLMVFRILEYCVLVWREFQQATKAAKFLPLILPVVVYLGKKPWNAPRLLRELHDVPAGTLDQVSDYVPECGYMLLDFSTGQQRAKDLELPGEPLGTVVLEVMRSATAGTLDRDMREIFRRLNEVKLDARQVYLLRQIGEYVLRKSELDGEKIRDRLRSEINETTESTVMSTYDRLMMQIEKGMQEGLEKGREEGEWIGKVQLLESLLGKASTAVGILQKESVKQLKARFARLEKEYHKKHRVGRKS
jgi:predicted transposase/invertase (TIGR01784 family)